MKTAIYTFLFFGSIELFFLQHFYRMQPNGFDFSTHFFFWGIFLLITSLSFFFGIERRHNFLGQGLDSASSTRQNTNALINQVFGLVDSLNNCYPIGFSTLLIASINLILYFIIL